MRPVQAIVVAYHAADELDRCLAALAATIDVMVVDNSSSVAVREVAASRGASYVDLRSNVGFGAGVNVALRHLLDGPSCDVLLVNPDAIVSPRDVDTLVSFLNRPGNERVGAVAPRLFGEDGREQRVIWPFPSPGRALAVALGLGRLPARRTFVVGAVLLLRWEAVREVGLFDERFFLYSEETDWQRRATERGWISTQCRDAVAVHVGGATSENASRRESLFHAAHETYVRKWYGSLGWAAYRAAVFLGAVARAIVLTGDRRSHSARVALLYVRGPCRSAAAPSER